MLFDSCFSSLKSFGPLRDSRLRAIALFTLGWKYPKFLDCLILCAWVGASLVNCFELFSESFVVYFVHEFCQFRFVIEF